MKMKVSLLISATLLLPGCFNIASAPSQISGSYTSEFKYNSYTCDMLSVEFNSLSRRESQLVTAQEQRRSSSMVQAFWIGYGNGDGVEASELANVRGEKEAVRRAMESKHCGEAQPTNTTFQANPATQSATNRDLQTIEEWRSKGVITDREADEMKKKLSGN